MLHRQRLLKLIAVGFPNLQFEHRIRQSGRDAHLPRNLSVIIENRIFDPLLADVEKPHMIGRKSGGNLRPVRQIGESGRPEHRSFPGGCGKLRLLPSGGRLIAPPPLPVAGNAQEFAVAPDDDPLQLNGGVLRETAVELVAEGNHILPLPEVLCKIEGLDAGP